MPDSWTVPTAALWAHLVMTPVRTPAARSARAIRFAEAFGPWIDDTETGVPWDFRTRQYRFSRFVETSKPDPPAPLLGGARRPWTTGQILEDLEDLLGTRPDRKTLLRALGWLCERGLAQRDRRGRRPIYRWLRRGRNEDWRSLAFPRLSARALRSCPLCREGWEHGACPDREFLEAIPWLLPWSLEDPD